MFTGHSQVERELLPHREKADKLMLILLGIQWFFATFVTSITYNTFLFGFISGGVLFIIPLLLYKQYKGLPFYRDIIVLSMMTFSSIFIQQQLGRIEMHFHVFVALAFLAYYKDPRPVVLATAHTVVYHITFNLLQQHNITIFDIPLRIYNYGCGWDITLLHAFFAISEGTVIGFMVAKERDNFYDLIISKNEIQELNSVLIRESKLKEKLHEETKQLQKALDENSIVSRTNEKGIITYANEKFCDISGYRHDELIGKSHNVVRHPDTSRKLFKEMWQTIKSKKVYKTKLKNLAKDGTQYYVDMTIIPLLNQEGEVYEYLSVRDDISELVATQELLAKEQSKDRFLANMSHELRTPLNAIIGFITLASQEKLSKKIKNYLDISLENSNQLLYLLNEILDLAKMKSGKFSLDNAPFKPKESLEVFVKTQTSNIKEKKLTYTSELHESLDHIVLDGDWQRINQVLTNLLSNAIKFTPSGGEISLKCKYEDQHLICHVRDSGIGLDKEAQKRIFKEFEQADSSTTRKYGGTGLGLTISSELISLMKGSLSVESKVGEGSTFTIDIPLQKLESADKSNPIETTSERKETFSGHVLIVEDNKTNQLLTKILLEDYGLTCDIANDGVEALGMYHEGAYDLILMDENMPNMGGIEAMQRLHQKYQNMVPIIALTANTMKGDRERFIEEGMDEFIPKPIAKKDLTAILKKFL